MGKFKDCLLITALNYSIKLLRDFNINVCNKRFNNISNIQLILR